MLLDKCIATVVYVSPSSDLLNIDSESLIEFLMVELQKVSPYAEKFQLNAILMPFLEEDFFAEVATVISSFIESGRVDKGFEREFLREIQE